MSLEQFSTLAQAAISYATLGLRVFPLSPLSKIPRFKDWPWQEAASNDPTIVQSWWARWPDSNIAIITDTFTVVDVDRKPGKADGWLQVGQTVDFETPWVATPNDGYHFYYQRSPIPLRSLPGVDVLTGNHYVLAPPSRLPGQAPWDADRTYQWGYGGPPSRDSSRGVELFGSPSLDLLLLLARRETRPTDTGSPDFPGLLDRLPSIPRAQLKESHQIFLQTGEVIGYPSRSELVMSLATRLYMLGYEDTEVVSMLWNEDWVQTTAQEHRRDQDRALEDWLWGTVRKVRHHRQKRSDEVFQAQETGRQEETHQSLRDRIMRMGPTDDLKAILRDIATARLAAVDEDDLITILCVNQGRKKTPLQQTLNAYKRDLIQTTSDAQKIRWRHTSGGDPPRPLPTVENLEILLGIKRATVWHNLMTHEMDVFAEGYSWGTEDAYNNQLTVVQSWAAEYQLPMGPVPEQLAMLSTKREYHPFQTWVEQRPWDGISRIPQLLRTIYVPEGKEAIRNTLVLKWLISICAAVWGYRNRAPRGVLTFTGDQQIGKTTWLKYLVPKDMYRQGLILRTDQRDSATSGLRCLIAEIGEIGTTFRRQDIEALKSYIGQHEDRYRLAYARRESAWKRRTIFAASANDQAILHDQTGNTRWWVVPVTGFNLDQMEVWWGNGYGAELQQLWAEVHMLYSRGEKWDLTDKELKHLEEHLETHLAETPFENLLRDTYAWENPRPIEGYRVHKRRMDILRDMGLGNRILSFSEDRQFRDALCRLTGQDKPALRKINLATLDGVKVKNDTTDKQVVGRWWCVPPLLNAPEGPFNG